MNYLKHTSDDICPGCESRLAQSDPYMAEWFRFMKRRFKNIHCSWVYRDEKSQNQAFKQKLSKLEYPQSKHNKLPSEAIDIFQIISGKAEFDSVFNHEIVKLSKANGFKLRYGAEFKTLGDSGHFEKV